MTWTEGGRINNRRPLTTSPSAVPISAASSKANPLRKGKAKASDSATPVEPKPKPKSKRKSGGGRKPGAQAWNCDKFLRFFWLIAEIRPSIAHDWISLAERHSAEQETNQIEKEVERRKICPQYFEVRLVFAVVIDTLGWAAGLLI